MRDRVYYAAVLSHFLGNSVIPSSRINCLMTVHLSVVGILNISLKGNIQHVPYLTVSNHVDHLFFQIRLFLCFLSFFSFSGHWTGNAWKKRRWSSLQKRTSVCFADTSGNLVVSETCKSITNTGSLVQKEPMVSIYSHNDASLFQLYDD